MTKLKFSLENKTSETLLLTLYARALESQKTNPLLNDSYAVKLVEQIDFDFSIFDNIPTTSAGIALRSIHFDQVTSDFIQANEQPIVVVVGCGLDTRKQRLGDIGDKAIFYQLDLISVIKLRKKLLPADKNEHYIGCCLLDEEWKDELLKKHPTGNFIFIIEGVLMYFNATDNRHFFNQIAERFDGAEIHFDMFNEWMSRNTALHEGVNKTEATFKFGLNDEHQLSNWVDGLVHEKTWLIADNPDWYRMGLPFVSGYLFNYTIQTAVKFLKFKIKNPQKQLEFF